MENEKRLIDVNTACERCRLKDAGNCGACIIGAAPTVDAVEVVRCRDCKYWGSTTGFCNLHSNSSKSALYWDLFDEDDFCSYGERRE